MLHYTTTIHYTICNNINLPSSIVKTFKKLNLQNVSVNIQFNAYGMRLFTYNLCKVIIC